MISDCSDQNGYTGLMLTVTVVDAKKRFSDLLRRAEHGNERVMVQRHGKPVAVIVSTDDLRRLEALEDVDDLADATAALKEARSKGTTALDVVLRRHGLAHLLVASLSGRRAAKTRAASRRTKA
jgi:prevent-host-death family protein